MLSVKVPALNRSLFSGFIFLFALACGGGGGGGGTTPTEDDTTPNSFSFASQATSDFSTWVESAAITIAGIDAASTVTVANGEYRIGSGSFTSANGSVTAGQSIVVRVMSAASAGQSTTVTLTVGGVSAGFEVTTLDPNAIITRVSNSSCIAPEQASSGNSGVGLQAAFPSLPNLPGIVGLYQKPNDTSRWYAMLQSGLVQSFENDPAANSLDTYIDLSALVTNMDEQGLLGMAFSPQFASNGEVYFSYINLSGQSEIVRFIDPGTVPLDAASGDRILILDQPATNHNGGNIAFGPDDYLYIGFGDGGGSNDTFNHGQNTQSFHATILRVDVNAVNYAIPPDNPFVNDANVRDEIYAYGLRNPWRWSFDMQNGDLWVGDVGQNDWEEVDLVEAGDNLGWPIMEGNHCLTGNSCDQTGLTLAIAEYNHDDGCSVTGGFVYRGSAIPSLQGHYLYGDYCSGRIFSAVKQANQTYLAEELLLSGLNVSSFAQSPDGEVYVLNYFGGQGGGIHQFVDASGVADNIPTNLSDTGCFTSTASKTYPDFVVPYDVTSLLWSDGVDKTRFLAIPDGTDIDLLSDGDFDLPERSILVKNFILNGEYLETRLFMRHVTGWAGYSYRWLPDQTDAVLVDGDDPEIVMVGNFEHIIPSRGQCFECHTNAANVSLGVEASQLNLELTYPNGNSGNQNEALASAGYLSNAPGASHVTPMASIDDGSASLDLRARSYLHSNCSGCHRPGGPGTQLDLRIQTALTDTQACGQAPSNGDLGINNALIIAPGESARSVLLARMQTVDSGVRMPPLASQVVDDTAVSVVSQWIDSLANCD